MSSVGRGLLLLFVSFCVSAAVLYAGALLVAPSEAETSSTEVGLTDTGPAAPDTSVNVIAKNLQFNVRSIAAVKGKTITVNFDNQDTGVLHNMAFYQDKTSRAKIYVGEVTTGVAAVQYLFQAPTTAGNYYFRCDVHPDQMTGTFAVK